MARTSRHGSPRRPLPACDAKGLREFLDAWEDEHGHFSTDEIEQARADLRSAIEGVAR
ncbi:MAG: hypothetical protein OXC71_08165 [Chloroflexi bacterium]|nr:hypothetical protein [Chloroflexota bacterium]